MRRLEFGSHSIDKLPNFPASVAYIEPFAIFSFFVTHGAMFASRPVGQTVRDT